MAELVASGRIADLILAVLAMEFVAVLVMRRLLPIGCFRTVVSALVPGACLVLALRFALTGAPWQAIAVSLAAAGLAHAADLWLRLRQHAPGRVQQTNTAAN